MRILTAIIAIAGAMALGVPAVATDAWAGGARHHAKKGEKVETTGSISTGKPMKDKSQQSAPSQQKDVSKRSAWGG